MMYPRLYLARNLLSEDGAIFISIDDHEVVNLRRLCDEVFGEENFVARLSGKRFTRRRIRRGTSQRTTTSYSFMQGADTWLPELLAAH